MRFHTVRLVIFGIIGMVLLAGAVPVARGQQEVILKQVKNVEFVAWVTGPQSPNKTDTRFDVDGTDLGSMFDLNGTLYIAFGDTFGCCRPAGGGAGGSHWRSNVLATSHDHKLDEGITFDTMIMDANGEARAVLQKDPETDITIIPTYGIGIKNRLYLHYMAVGIWGPPGQWTLNRSGWAYSDDQGQTWTQPADAIWKGDTNFGQAALVQHNGYVYVMGIHGGRFGGVALARVLPDDILNMSAYRYWDGTTWNTDLASAAIVVPAPVGELSVAWNDYLGRWIMTYLDEPQHAIVIREAPDLTGPWSNTTVVVSADDYPSLYGAFLHPWTSSDNVIYFNMSQWGPYNVRLMRAELVK